MILLSSFTKVAEKIAMSALFSVQLLNFENKKKQHKKSRIKMIGIKHENDAQNNFVQNYQTQTKCKEARNNQDSFFFYKLPFI